MRTMYSPSMYLLIAAAVSFVAGFSNAFVVPTASTTVIKRGVALCVSKTHALDWLRDAPDDLALIRRRTTSVNKNNDLNDGKEEQDEIPLYKGVYRQRNKKWKAMISWQGQRHHLGCYESQHEAAVMYAKAAWMLQHPNNSMNNNNANKSDKTHKEKVPFFLISDDDLEETEQEESFLEDLIAISSDLRDFAVHEYKKIDWGQVKHKVEDFFENSEMIHALQEESVSRTVLAFSMTRARDWASKEILHILPHHPGPTLSQCTHQSWRSKFSPPARPPIGGSPGDFVGDGCQTCGRGRPGN